MGSVVRSGRDQAGGQAGKGARPEEHTQPRQEQHRQEVVNPFGQNDGNTLAQGNPVPLSHDGGLENFANLAGGYDHDVGGKIQGQGLAAGQGTGQIAQVEFPPQEAEKVIGQAQNTHAHHEVNWKTTDLPEDLVPAEEKKNGEVEGNRHRDHKERFPSHIPRKVHPFCHSFRC